MIILAGLMTLLAGGVTALVCFANGMRSTPGIFQGGSLILFAWFIAFAFWFAALAPVHAHDHNHPERNEWLKSLHSKNKAWCCDGNDVTYLDGSDWEMRGNRYRVRIEGEWLDVPDGAVIEEPNHAGRALVWIGKGYSGTSIRCFAPGSMT